MKRRLPFIFFITILFLMLSCAHPHQRVETNLDPDKKVDERILTITESIKPFFKTMGEPKPMEWLSTFHEPGQTFREYVDLGPSPPASNRRVIYVVSLGTLKHAETNAIKITAGYLEAFFGLTVKSLPPLEIKRPLRLSDARINPFTKAEQIRTGFLLETLLPPLVPQDAAVLIAFTNVDLYPDASMSYVFGQANNEKRTAVWSLNRLNDKHSPDVFLRRAIKIAAHETGHLFAMRHCTKYVCLMSGTNHLQETDSHPVDACPECTAKICWLLKLDPIERYKKLAEFCRRNGLTAEAKEFENKASVLTAAYAQNQT